MDMLMAVDIVDISNIVNNITDYETEDISGSSEIAFYPIPYYKCPSVV